jgi:hypothetical protein
MGGVRHATCMQPCIHASMHPCMHPCIQAILPPRPASTAPPQPPVHTELAHLYQAPCIAFPSVPLPRGNKGDFGKEGAVHPQGG